MIDLCPNCGHVIPPNAPKSLLKAEDVAANAFFGTVGGCLAFCVAMGIGFNVWLSIAVWMGAGYAIFDRNVKRDVAQALQRRHGG